ncbi:hypothetical protein B0T24DRAFT_237009 [Lasiosphaeria ovina]|uniref:Uncharacterized protein n=1 Tax=Lasiosphaeria ovina TaxID=92902 RepID=A0AAE0KID1_9PEZI|nr:hypothetical protein B0T24DRAFT_237009 [Lasiosphaeria ovina]
MAAAFGNLRNSFADPNELWGGESDDPDLPGPANISFRFSPTGDRAKGDWKAWMLVTAKDIPQLMRQGFHWTQDNIVHEEGSIMTNNIDPELDKEGYTVRRQYFLKDMSGHYSKWKAWLNVMAPRTEILSKFPVSQLKPTQIYYAKARNHRRETCYIFDSSEPKSCFNTIFEGQEMVGFWPKMPVELFMDPALLGPTVEKSPTSNRLPAADDTEAIPSQSAPGQSPPAADKLPTADDTKYVASPPTSCQPSPFLSAKG